MTCPCKTHPDWTTVPPCDLHWPAYFREFISKATIPDLKLPPPSSSLPIRRFSGEGMTYRVGIDHVRCEDGTVDVVAKLTACEAS